MRHSGLRIIWTRPDLRVSRSSPFAFRLYGEPSVIGLLRQLHSGQREWCSLSMNGFLTVSDQEIREIFVNQLATGVHCTVRTLSDPPSDSGIDS